MNLPNNVQEFILHFGEMGSKWGINRTVGQIYALLYLSEKPLNADQIVDSLGFSRSNVAMGLKELVNMNLVMLKHLPADRKDYYGTHEDLWDIVFNLIEARRKREIEPTLTVLRSLLLNESDADEQSFEMKRIKEMHDLMESLSDWYDDIKRIPVDKLMKLMKLGTHVYSLYQFKDKLTLTSNTDKHLEDKL